VISHKITLFNCAYHSCTENPSKSLFEEPQSSHRLDWNCKESNLCILTNSNEMSAINYSKWDNIELSDDEDIECHPNVNESPLWLLTSAD
jgi:hypothetical protein